MNYLKIAYEPDDQWMGRVTVLASSGSFSGSGQAWMNVEDLAAFADAVGRYPLPPEMPHLSGGYVGYETVSVAVSPFDELGRLLVTVKLANDDMRLTERSSLHEDVTVRFIAEYAGLDRFAKELATVVNAQAGEAILTGAG